jgi:hypothetical protein
MSRIVANNSPQTLGYQLLLALLQSHRQMKLHWDQCIDDPSLWRNEGISPLQEQSPMKLGEELHEFGSAVIENVTFLTYGSIRLMWLELAVATCSWDPLQVLNSLAEHESRAVRLSRLRLKDFVRQWLSTNATEICCIEQFVSQLLAGNGNWGSWVKVGRNTRHPTTLGQCMLAGVYWRLVELRREMMLIQCGAVADLTSSTISTLERAFAEIEDSCASFATAAKESRQSAPTDGEASSPAYQQLCTRVETTRKLLDDLVRAHPGPLGNPGKGLVIVIPDDTAALLRQTVSLLGSLTRGVAVQVRIDRHRFPALEM